MTTIVGIFDNERDLDKSVGRLAHAGFEYTVYDEAIVAEEPGSFGSLVFWSGYGPAVSGDSNRLRTTCTERPTGQHRLAPHPFSFPTSSVKVIVDLPLAGF
jgi:hypothetical protein